jgi:hypothetical protein
LCCFNQKIIGDKDTSVEKLCEAMQRMLVQLMEQSQSKSSSSSDSLKIMLEQNPIKLFGPEDYFSWARNASLILGLRSTWTTEISKRGRG